MWQHCVPAVTSSDAAVSPIEELCSSDPRREPRVYADIGFLPQKQPSQHGPARATRSASVWESQAGGSPTHKWFIILGENHDTCMKLRRNAETLENDIYLCLMTI